MIKKLLVFSLFVIGLMANAYSEEASTGKYADKFKPSSGLKIKESNVAARMENATRNAAYDDNNDDDGQWVRKRTKEKDYSKNTNVRTYKWF